MDIQIKIPFLYDFILNGSSRQGKSNEASLVSSEEEMVGTEWGEEGITAVVVGTVEEDLSGKLSVASSPGRGEEVSWMFLFQAVDKAWEQHR